MTSARTITVEVALSISSDRVFNLLCTPSEIRSWWNADRAIVIPERGGMWIASWGEEDDPDYISGGRIEIFDPPKQLVLVDQCYFAKTGGLPFELNSTTTFDVSPTFDGCLLTVTQDGFPNEAEADEIFVGCQKGWRDTFDSIKRYVGGGL